MEAGRRPEDPAVIILRWSELGEADKCTHFERAHNYPAHHPGIDAMRDRIVRSGHFGYPNENMMHGELERMPSFSEVERGGRDVVANTGSPLGRCELGLL
jgi:hypothetical protein